MQEGCDKFCTFCVVPYTRGAEFSRGVDAIMAEARDLCPQGGAREIVLIGQNVNAWHGAAPVQQAREARGALATCIRCVAGIGGVERIRYMTSHPRDMADDPDRAHRDIEVLALLIHLPVQAGARSDPQAMNRQHTAGNYLRIDRSRVRGGPAGHRAGVDFIVGFRGESTRTSKTRWKLVEAVGFARAYPVQIFAPPRHACAPAWRSGRGAREGRAPGAAAGFCLASGATPSAPQCIGRRVKRAAFPRQGKKEAQALGYSPLHAARSTSNNGAHLANTHRRGRNRRRHHDQPRGPSLVEAESGCVSTRPRPARQPTATRVPTGEPATAARRLRPCALSPCSSSSRLLPMTACASTARAARSSSPSAGDGAKLERPTRLQASRRPHRQWGGSHHRRTRSRHQATSASHGVSAASGEAIQGLRKPIMAQTPGQRSYLAKLRRDDLGLIFGVGPAGTGKTYLAVAMAAAELKSGKRERIVVARPAVEAGEKLGFLPGDASKRRSTPTCCRVWDALNEMLGCAGSRSPQGARARSRWRRSPSCAAAR